MIEILLLGPLQVRVDGATVDDLATSKVQALLAYLAVENEHPHHRQKLAGLLWPDFADDSARVNLRQALKRLRQLLPADAVWATRQEVGLHCEIGCRSDLDRFIELLRIYRQRGEIEALQQAVELYRGDFLQQLWVEGCVDFEEWVLLKREWLRREVMEALHQLAAYGLEQGQLDGAVQAARRQLALDPLNELARRQLMESLARTGRRTEALQQFEECQRILRRELDVMPARATIALAERIRMGGDGWEGGSRHPAALPATAVGSEPDLPAGAQRSHQPPPELPGQRHNLPDPTTPLLGREAEIAALVALLAGGDTRLVTLTGPGGIGKTRLALAAGRQLVDRAVAQGAGVYFVPLHSVRSAEAVAPAIADAMNLQLASHQSPQQQLASYLQAKPLLLILDNFEHLLDGVQLLVELLQTCPPLRLLVTSRQRLDLKGEQLLALGGLAYPVDSASPATAFPAVRLFLQTAQRVRHDFAVDAEALAQIAAICRQVEGMPLALELAAGWVSALPLREIAHSVVRSLDALASSARDLPHRHRSMRTLFDMMWQRMDSAEQQLFGRLAHFRGGFSRDAAEQVAGASLMQLAALVNKSLVRYDPAQDRYSLHELLRQYGQEMLARMPQEAAAVEERHSAYFCHWLTQQSHVLTSIDRPMGQTIFALELENIVQAWEWAVHHRRVERLQPVVDAFGTLLYRMARYHEGASLFEQALQQLNERWSDPASDPGSGAVSDHVCAQLLLWSGDCLHFLGQTEQARRRLERALAILNRPELAEMELASTRARALVFLGNTLTGEPARRCYGQALELARTAGDGWLEGAALQALAELLLRESLGTLDAARESAERALHKYREVGDAWGVSWNLQTLSAIALDRGDIGAGRRAIGESLQIRQRLGIRGNVGRCHGLLGALATAAGEFEAATAQLQQGLAIWVELNLPAEAVPLRVELALSMLHAGCYDAARAEIAGVQALCQSQPDLQFGLPRVHYLLGLLALAEGAFAEARRYLQISAEQSLFPTRRAHAYGGLALAARGVGAEVEARAHLEAALQCAAGAENYSLALYLLNAASLLLADAGELDYARQLSAAAVEQPFNARSRWVGQVIRASLADALHADDAGSGGADGGHRPPAEREWVQRIRAGCGPLLQMVERAQVVRRNRAGR